MKINMKIEDKDIKTVVPPLRFPEFRDAEGWRITALSEVLSYERPDNYIVSNTNYCQQGIPVLTANKSFILGYTKDDHGIYNSYPVIIFDDFTTDKKYVDFPFKVKSSAIKILKSKNGSNLRFVFEMMSLIRFEAKEHKRYYISSYQTLNICIPKQCEQTKIADCLSSLDDLISAVTDKIEALKEYKKGLMQQLFPAEGKTTPALRFPEFQNAGEWEQKTLEKIASKIGDGIHGTPKYIDNSEYFFVNGNNLVNGQIVISPNTKCVSENEYISQKKDLDENTILISINGTIGNIAKYNGEKIILGKSAAYLKFNNNRSFFYQILQSPQVMSYFESELSGSTIKNLSLKSIRQAIVCIPSKIEQQKIADCFSSLDELISAETDKLDQLKTHKKGLMQQLFPTITK